MPDATAETFVSHQVLSEIEEVARGVTSGSYALRCAIMGEAREGEEAIPTPESFRGRLAAVRDILRYALEHIQCCKTEFGIEP